jgi:hypothetical protein
MAGLLLQQQIYHPDSIKYPFIKSIRFITPKKAAEQFFSEYLFAFNTLAKRYSSNIVNFHKYTKETKKS